MKGATEPFAQVARVPHVSIHAPVKGATPVNTMSAYVELGFNPRPREGGDRPVSRVVPFGRVSIHAPVKGATAAAIIYDVAAVVSIHAPVKGATRLHQ